MHDKRSNKPQILKKKNDTERKNKPGAEIKEHESPQSGSEEEGAEEDRD